MLALMYSGYQGPNGPETQNAARLQGVSDPGLVKSDMLEGQVSKTRHEIECSFVYLAGMEADLKHSP